MYRYALYYAPSSDSLLGQFGNSWLGLHDRDPDASRIRTFAEITMAEWSEAVERPRRYGFHATLKPPFRMRTNRREPELLNAIDCFCRSQPPIAIGHLEPGTVSDFLAMIPAETCMGEQAALKRFASNCVRIFDPFRAPPTEAEILSRNPDRLRPEQKRYLYRWGYPWLMTAYRFHMTLTGPLRQADRERFLKEIGDLASAALAEPLVMDDLCLFGQPAPDTGFRILHRFPLSLPM